MSKTKEVLEEKIALSEEEVKLIAAQHEKASGARRLEPPANQKPSAGRIVMFCDTFKPGAIYPAIIAEVIKEVQGPYPYTVVDSVVAPYLVDLAVIDIYQNPCIRPQRYVRYSEGKEPGTWHWPERV